VGPGCWFRDVGEEGVPVETDRDGHFSFRVTPRQRPDEIVVAIHKERRLRGHVRMPDASLAATRTTPPIRLDTTGIVRGRIVEGDKPIAGADVQLSEYMRVQGDPSGRALTMNRDFAKTDENGRFEFPFVEADRTFQLAVHAKGLTHDQRRGQVAAGQALEMEPFALMRLDKSVAGVVVDPNGKPVAGVSVSAQLRAGASIGVASTNRPTGNDGRFVIRGVPNAPLRLMAYIRPPEGPTANRIRFSAKVDVEPGQTDARIVLDPTP
jgi:hypothetical protein